MSRGPVWAVTAAALAVGAWFVLRPAQERGPEGGPEPLGAEEGGARPGEAEAAVGGASLARTDPARVRKDRGGGAARGASAIVGVVRRDGRPVAAQVEVVHVGEVQNQRGWSYETWFARLLDPPTTEPGFATARSGEDGRYAIEGVGVGQFQLRARDAEGARGDGWAQVPVDGARVEANLAIAAGGETLQGRVVYADGRPFKGVAVVEPTGTPGRNAYAQGARSDPVRIGDDGRFTVTGLPVGQAAIAAYDPGVLRATSLPIPIPYAGEFTFTVDAGTTAVSGRVVADADGAPVPGAAVLAGGQGGVATIFAAKATTDAEGRFALPMSPNRGTTVTARAAGFAVSVRSDVDLRAPLELRLVRAARVTGRVATPEGAGVEGLVVQAAPVSRQTWGIATEPATTSADGTFALEDLFAGEAMVIAEGKGWSTKGLDTVRDGGFNALAVTLRPGETTKADVVVTRGSVVLGVVKDADGTGVLGAVVRAEPGPRTDRGRSVGSSWATPPAAVTGADGAFAVEGLIAGGTYVLAATAAGRAVARSDPVILDPAAPAKVEIRLAPERRLEVQVVAESDGAPVPGASITASVESTAGGWRGEGGWSTGSDGRALVGPLAPGAARVNVYADGWLAPEAQTVAVGEATALTFRLQRGLTISGKVVMPDKSPAAGYRVAVQTETGRGGRQSPTTGLDGTFTAGGLAAGTYRLSVEGAVGTDGAPLSGTATSAAGGDPVTIVLAVGAGGDRKRLLVRALDPDGRPIPRARVTFRVGGSTTGAQVQDGKATLQLGDREEAGAVIVSAPTTAAGMPLPYAPKTVTDVKPTAGEVEVKLEPGRTLAGFVRGPDGMGVRGALVFATEARDASGQVVSPRGAQNAVSSARTDAGGAYRIEGLGSDDVLVSADVPPEFLAPEPVTARAGPGGLDFTLKVAAQTTVTVLDDRDRPVAGASVSFRSVARPAEPRRHRGHDPGWNATTDARGTAQVGGLDPAGRFDMTVAPPEAREDLQAASQNDVPARDLTVRLEAGYLLEVRVTDLAGKPVGGAQVHRVLSNGSMNGEGERSPGVFRLRRLPAGEVTLVAAMSGVPIHDPKVDDPRVGRLTTRADAGTVTIRIDPGVDLVVRVEGATRRDWWNALLVEEVADASKGGARSAMGSDGDLRWRGLRADATYTLWIPPEPGSAVACFKKGLRAGGEVTVALEKGLSITGRISVPAGATQTNVNAWNELGLHAQGKVDADGRYEVAGLPSGTRWRVGANARIGESWAHAQSPSDVPAGSTLDLEVKKGDR